MSSQNGKTTAAVISTIMLVLLFGFKVARVIMRSNRSSTRSNTEFVDKFRAKAYLRTLVDTVNYYRCPYFDNLGQVDSFQYKEGGVVVHITLDEESADRIQSIKSNEEKVKEAYMTLYSYPRFFQSAILEVLAVADGGMILDFRAKNSDDSCLLYISSYRVGKAAQDTTVSVMDYLLAENELINTQGVDANQDIYMEKVAMEGNYRVYYYQCKDYVISYINSIRSQRKREILNIYKEEDGEDLLKEAGLGMKYIYVNDRSGKECVITIENHEL